MNDLFFILLLILVPLLIIGIPLVLSIWAFRILKRKTVNPIWRILAILPILIVGYIVYDSIYPSSKFYKTDFKEVTGIELPEDSEFEYKTAGYPDTHGDYSSVSVINIGRNFYAELEVDLAKNGLTECGRTIGCKELANAKRNMNGLKIEREFSKDNGDRFYYVAFLSDKESILVQRSSH